MRASTSSHYPSIPFKMTEAKYKERSSREQMSRYVLEHTLSRLHEKYFWVPSLTHCTERNPSWDEHRSTAQEISFFLPLLVSWLACISVLNTEMIRFSEMFLAVLFRKKVIRFRLAVLDGRVLPILHILQRSQLQRMNGTLLFWDVMLCSLIEVYWLFGGMYCLHPQGGRESRVKKQQGGELSKSMEPGFGN
jgi:hypothetical protein